MGALALVPATGFLIIYFGGYRKKGRETFNQEIWWDHLRPVHAILYLTFAYLAFNKSSESYKPLLADVMLGLVSFLHYHYSAGNFKKLVQLN